MTGFLVENCAKTPSKVPESHLMGVAQMDFYPQRCHIFSAQYPKRYHGNPNGSHLF